MQDFANWEAQVQHYANSLKSKMRIWKYFCSSVYTGQSHWRGSIVAIFLPVQCYWEVTAIWHAHINLQLTSPSLGLSFHSTKPYCRVEVVLRKSLPQVSL
uniref:Uncharacterized protein n=1 Tax=Populus trichocarpa TaxID=3694 RepID=A0A3N7FPD3_POPTR